MHKLTLRMRDEACTKHGKPYVKQLLASSPRVPGVCVDCDFAGDAGQPCVKCHGCVQGGLGACNQPNCKEEGPIGSFCPVHHSAMVDRDATRPMPGIPPHTPSVPAVNHPHTDPSTALVASAPPGIPTMYQGDVDSLYPSFGTASIAISMTEVRQQVKLPPGVSKEYCLALIQRINKNKFLPIQVGYFSKASIAAAMALVKEKSAEKPALETVRNADGTIALRESDTGLTVKASNPKTLADLIGALLVAKPILVHLRARGIEPLWEQQKFDLFIALVVEDFHVLQVRNKNVHESAIVAKLCDIINNFLEFQGDVRCDFTDRSTAAIVYDQLRDPISNTASVNEKDSTKVGLKDQSDFRVQFPDSFEGCRKHYGGGTCVWRGCKREHGTDCPQCKGKHKLDACPQLAKWNKKASK